MGFSLMEEPIDIVGRRSTGSLLARREWSDQGLSSGTRTPTSTKQCADTWLKQVSEHSDTWQKQVSAHCQNTFRTL